MIRNGADHIYTADQPVESFCRSGVIAVEKWPHFTRRRRRGARDTTGSVLRVMSESPSSYTCTRRTARAARDSLRESG